MIPARTTVILDGDELFCFLALSCFMFVCDSTLRYTKVQCTSCQRWCCNARDVDVYVNRKNGRVWSVMWCVVAWARHGMASAGRGGGGAGGGGPGGAAAGVSR